MQKKNCRCGAIISLQCYYRGKIARSLYYEMRLQQATIKVQTFVRMSLARSLFKKRMRGIILLQNRRRCQLAIREYKRLKVEAKQVGNLLQNNQKLQTEIHELKKALELKAEEVRKEEEAKFGNKRRKLKKSTYKCFMEEDLKL